MNLDSAIPRPVIRAAFEKVLREKVEWIARKCWKMNLETHIRQINDVLSSGSELGVSSARLLTDEEIKELFSTISPLKTLEMDDEIHKILIKAVCELGISPTIFASKASEVHQEA